MEIEDRLQTVLDLIRAGEYSTPGLASKLGVSIPTVSRAVCALRERGHRIRSVRRGTGWRYVLDETGAESVDENDGRADVNCQQLPIIEPVAK